MKKLITVDAETLLYRPLVAPDFVLDGLIPAGLSLFCGTQKIGKSWLILKLCLQLSKGEPMWGIPTKPCTVKACEMAGIEKIPAIIRDMDRDTAVIALVDSNIHRENILPSERAFAYKMKLEAIKYQGKTSSQLATKLSLDEVGLSDDVSGDTVWRYIRLTNLSSDILQLVDEKKIAISSTGALSYLTEKEQSDLYQTIESEDCTPSYSQSIQMKKLSQQGALDMDKIFEIMAEVKPNQQEHYKFKREDIHKYFPKTYTDKQIQDTLFKLLEQWQRRKQQERESR